MTVVDIILVWAIVATAMLLMGWFDYQFEKREAKRCLRGWTKSVDRLEVLDKACTRLKGELAMSKSLRDQIIDDFDEVLDNYKHE